MNGTSISKWGLAVTVVGTIPGLLFAQSGGAEPKNAAAPVAEAKKATGTISGKVSFGEKTGLKNRQNEFVNVVVSVEDIELSDAELGTLRSSREIPVIDQKDMTFRPHVLPIVIGTTVDFPNSDPLFHNVYSNNEPKRFDLGMYPKGQSKQIAFEEPGIVELRCKVHSEMQAFILIKKNPYFAVVERDGTFRIENVPPGSHTIEFWHPKAESIAQEVAVEAGSTAELSVQFTGRRGQKG